MAAGMTKTQLVRHLAEKTEINNKTAAAFLEQLADTAIKETKKNGVFVVPGLGRLVKAHRNITVNTISPGWIEDSVVNSLPEPVQNTIRDWQHEGWTPMRRMGTPADIGNAVSLICSEEASWITGQLIDVDGGASLMNSHIPLEIQQAVQKTAKAA